MELRTDRLDFIDALRGWAALGVITVHSGLICAPPQFLGPLVSAGARGVQLFFIISAFTMFYTLSNNNAILHFFVRRFFRIAPLFYFVLILSVINGNNLPGRYWSPDGSSYLDIILTALFLNGWNPAMYNSLVDGGWTIAVEMNFYLLVPFLFFAIRTTKIAILCIPTGYVLGKMLSSVISQAYFPKFPETQFYLIESWKWMGLPGSLFIFLCGILVYFVWRDWNKFLSALQPQIYTKILYILLLLFLMLVYSNNNDMKYFVLLFMLIFIASSQCDSRLMHNKYIIFIGKISYSTYLLHFFVLNLIVKNSFPWVISLCLLISLTILISYLSYKFIEQPGQKLGKRLVNKYFAKVHV